MKIKTKAKRKIDYVIKLSSSEANQLLSDLVDLLSIAEVVEGSAALEKYTFVAEVAESLRNL